MAWRKPKTTQRPPTPAAVQAERMRGITAATATVELGRESSWASWKFNNSDWQKEAWRLYDIVPELRFLAGWIGDSVSQARLYVTEVDKTGEETGEVEDQSISRLGAQPLGSGAQRDDNLRLLGVNLAISGEAWVVGEAAMTNEPQDWFVVSGAQINRTGNNISIRRPLSSGGRVLTLTNGEDLLMRAWRPHPNDIWQSDSPTRSAIPALREIELLTKREFAELESRLVGAGLWFLPEGVDFPRGEGDPEGMTGAMAMLQRAAAENIREQSSASALVPIIATIPHTLLEHLDKFKDPTRFWSELSEHILPMKEKAIGRVAASFEIPSEISTGLGNANHWSAWAIGEEGIKRIKPYLATIADTLTRGFLVPSLQREGIKDPERYAYAFDVAPLSVRPNRLPEALELWDRFLITDDEAVRSGAFSESDMPDEQERLKSLLFRSVAKDPSLLADPGVQSALGMNAPISINSTSRPAIESTPTPSEREDSPPADQSTPPADQTPPGTLSTIEELNSLINSDPTTELAITASPENVNDLIVGACEQAVLHALGVAGGRLATHADRRNRYHNIPKHEIHAHIGDITPERADKVLRGAWRNAPALARRLDIEPRLLESALNAYCFVLLTHGMKHTEELLAAALQEVI